MPAEPNAELSPSDHAFAPDRPLDVGLEEELMLLDPETLDLRPCADAVLGRLAGDARFKPELPAAQLEIVCAPAATVPAAASALLAARRELVRAAAPDAVPAGAGVHPFADGLGTVNPAERYRRIASEFGCVARRQLVFGLHVHVAVGGSDVALAVYNALREHLPAIAALGAASPFYEGRDTGLASVRPKLSDLLPRQGIPPVIRDWHAFSEAITWGGRAGAFADAQWWWEARPHPVHGTVEVRVADAQATAADTAAIAAVVHALVALLGEQAEAGALPEPAETWKIAENRWSACRHGVLGEWVDVRTGERGATADHLEALFARLGPVAARLGCAGELAAARGLVASPRAERAREAGPRAWAASLAERFAVG